jgi:hypothetical protein
MNIKLSEVSLPYEELPPSPPSITGVEYQKRIEELYARAGMDWVAVYADREHIANLTFLTGYDPRFEEALLLVGPRQQRYMIVGNEGRGYVPMTTSWIDVLLGQSMSLAGQPRSTAPRLLDVMKTAGIGQGARVGMVGWKYLEPTESDEPDRPAYVPAFMVDTMRKLVGPAGVVTDVTAIMMHPAHGMRANNSAAQIAFFEWYAMRASASVFRIMRGTRPGMSGDAAVALMKYEGDPLSAHVMFATGKGDIVGLSSPSSKLVELGDGVTTAVSFWGSLVCRAGMVQEPDPQFVSRFCRPYFSAMATWYESLKIGSTGGEIYSAVTAAFGDASFNSMLNPGHLVSYDEWVHSPIRPDSSEKIASGMALQSDIIPYPLPAGIALNCEDTLVIADQALRAQTQADFPDMWLRMQARRNFMQRQLGIHLADEVLPLSTAPAYLPPFWLKNNMVCTIE